MCYSAYWFVLLVIKIVLLFGLLAIWRALAPRLAQMFGEDGPLVLRIVQIVFAVIVAVWLIWLGYDLLVCMSVIR